MLPSLWSGAPKPGILMPPVASHVDLNVTQVALQIIHLHSACDTLQQSATPARHGSGRCCPNAAWWLRGTHTSKANAAQQRLLRRCIDSQTAGRGHSRRSAQVCSRWHWRQMSTNCTLSTSHALPMSCISSISRTIPSLYQGYSSWIDATPAVWLACTQVRRL